MQQIHTAIQMLYGEIQCNGYIQQYGYNTDAIWRNTMQQMHTAKQMPYGEIQSATSFLNKQYNSWWKVQRSTLQFYSLRFREEHAWRHKIGGKTALTRFLQYANEV